MPKRNLAKAVHDKCIDCIYDPLAAGQPVTQVLLCTVYKCPLWPVRPVGSMPQSPGKVTNTILSRSVAEGYGVSEPEWQRLIANPHVPPDQH